MCSSIHHSTCNWLIWLSCVSWLSWESWLSTATCWGPNRGFRPPLPPGYFNSDGGTWTKTRFFKITDHIYSYIIVYKTVQFFFKITWQYCVTGLYYVGLSIWMEFQIPTTWFSYCTETNCCLEGREKKTCAYVQKTMVWFEWSACVVLKMLKVHPHKDTKTFRLLLRQKS